MEALSRIINWLNIHRKLSVYFLLGFVIVSCLAFLWFNFAVISVSVVKPKGTPQSRVYTVSSNGYEIKEIGESGLHIIPRKTGGIIVEAGKNIRTLSTVKIPWFGFTSKKVQLSRDKNAKKIAYKSTLDYACGTYSNKFNRLAQYSCEESPPALVYYDAPARGIWQIKNIAKPYYPNFAPKQYKGGLLGISFVNGPDSISTNKGDNVVYLSESGRETRYNQPEGVDISKINQSKIFTDHRNQNNKFILVTTNGNIYLGTPRDDSSKVDYKRIQPPKEYNQDIMQTTCTINLSQAFCIRGKSQEVESTTNYTDKATIVSLNFNSSEIKEFKVDDPGPVQRLEQTDNNEIYANVRDSIYLFEKDREFAPRILSTDTRSMSANEAVYYIKDNGVFRIDAKTHDSHQVFYSHNIKPSKIVISNQNVFILGKTSNDEENTYAWRLNNEDDLSYGNRTIDKLPSFPASAAYGDTDLVEERIRITVEANRGTTKRDIDRKTKQTLDYLKDIGVDTNKLHLVR